MDARWRAVSGLAIAAAISAAPIFAQADAGKTFYVFIRNPMLNCHLCQILLEDFLNTLRRLGLGERVVAIYIPVDGPAVEIQEKQVVRYLRTCHYDFPLIVDRFRILHLFGLEGYDVMVIDRDQRKKMKFPLSADDWKLLRGRLS